MRLERGGGGWRSPIFFAYFLATPLCVSAIELVDKFKLTFSTVFCVTLW